MSRKKRHIEQQPGSMAGLCKKEAGAHTFALRIQSTKSSWAQGLHKLDKVRQTPGCDVLAMHEPLTCVSKLLALPPMNPKQTVSNSSFQLSPFSLSELLQIRNRLQDLSSTRVLIHHCTALSLQGVTPDPRGAALQVDGHLGPRDALPEMAGLNTHSTHPFGVITLRLETPN